MPDGRQVAVWGFAKDSSAGAGDGVVTVPGPQLNVAAGESLTIHLSNSLPEPASIVVPGQYNYDSLDPAFHGSGPYEGRVRSLTREAAAGGGSATYSWTSVTSGTFLYHSGSHPSVEVQMGLYGALVVAAPGPQAYAGVGFNSSATLLFSEIDPEVHDAVASHSFGPGPAYLPGDFTSASAAAFISQINASTDPVAQFVAGQLVSGNTVSALINDLNTIVGGSCIYTPELFPDESVLSDAAIYLLLEAPEVNQPQSNVSFNGTMVRLNRLLLQDGLANAGISLPIVNKMTSTIRSYPQYFLVNGQPYTNNQPPIAAGPAASTILLRMLNAGMDAHVPTLNNGGDFQLVAEDGQAAPYPRSASAVFMPALKTVDALWTPASAGNYAIYDRRLGVVNGTQSPGGMLAFLSVGAPAASTPPTILIPPASQTVAEFTTATFTVVASGSGLTYQWQRNGTAIAGATSPSYSLANVSRTTDNGALFRVTVSGTGGPAVTTPAATLNVSPAAPTIVTQPISHNVTPPAVTAFFVVATGSTPLTYQWQKAASALGPYAPIAGATLATLTLSPSSAASIGFYKVVVTGPGGSTTSVAAELRVAPAIVTQPASVLVADLATATFTVGATGSGLTYQWSRRPGTTGTFTSITGATSSSYSFQTHYLADNGAQFRVVVSGSGGAAVTSGNATLTVTPANSAPLITAQPVSVATNGGAAQVTFTVGAYGYPAPTYQWQRNNGIAWVNLANTGGFSGVTTSNLTVASGSPTISVADAGAYRVHLANSSGAVDSSAASLTVNQTFTSLGALLRPSGVAFPYPTASPSVPAFTGAQVQKVTVNLTSLTFPEPYDLSALLVTPGTPATARKVEILEGLGAIPAPFEGGVYSYPVSNVNLVFDDAAPGPASPYYPLASGTYQPTITEPITAFPAPAPGLPYATALSNFNGFVQTSAGAWRLYILGTPTDTPLTSGGLLLAWSLNLTVGPSTGTLQMLATPRPAGNSLPTGARSVVGL
jgi:FtsP/CotA-like multicopper oxidase with cupredoxin domain